MQHQLKFLRTAKPANTGLLNSALLRSHHMRNIPASSGNFLRIFKPTALAAMSIFMSQAMAFDSGSNGADGALSPSVNTEIQLPPSGILNYISINIPVGVTVKFKRNALNTPVYILVSGNATIAGTIDIKGGDSPAVGTAGDGNQADDGLPGIGGPGGFDGGRGGKSSPTASILETRGGGGFGPGGGMGGYWPTVIDGNWGGSNGIIYYPAQGGSARFNDRTDPTAISAGAGLGEMYGSNNLVPLIGGSGGGGGAGGTNSEGSGGGGGGGAILLAASGTLNITGSILAYGGTSGKNAGTGAGAFGGGGSGGAIRLIATTLTGNGILNTKYGCQYYSIAECYYTQSMAGQGRVRIEGDSITYSGTSYPAYTSDTPSPVFLANLPILRIASIGGQAVPANPTGNADLTFPASLSNPVTINLTTTNVPTGNIVKVKVIPAYGATQEFISPAITGSTASGVASVQVTLPQGASVIQAQTSYTVVVAMGEALSRFAQNERVEKVEIMATLGQSENQAKLITISGKEYIVPASVLQMVGFKG